MHIALIEVHRRGARPDIISVETEEELTERLDKLQASESTLRIHVFRPTETLTRKVIFASS
jgi:hypothetical protein